MRAIVTKYHGPTNFRGSRVSAIDEGYSDIPRRVTVSWDHALSSEENHAAAVRAAVRRWGWSGRWIGGGLRHGWAFVYAGKAPKGREFVVEVP